MLTINKVVFGYSESSVIKENVYFSLSQANRLISKAAFEETVINKRSGYFKTDVTVFFSNDTSYKYRHDIGDYSNDILEHLKSQYLFYSGSKQPSHMTYEQYQRCIRGFSSTLLDTLSQLDYSAIGA